MYQTIQKMAAHFPYWSHKKMERMLNELRRKGVIIKGNFNNKPFDRTAWYTFTDTWYARFANSFGQNREMHFPKSGNGNPEIGKCNIEDTKEKDTEEKKEKIKKKKPKPSPKKCPPIPKKSFGPKGSVLLTENEHAELCQTYGSRLIDAKILDLEDYMESTGKVYKSHAATLRSWLRKQGASPSGSPPKRRDADSYAGRNRPEFKFNVAVDCSNMRQDENGEWYELEE